MAAKKRQDPQITALNRDRELDEPGSGLTDHEKVRSRGSAPSLGSLFAFVRCAAAMRSMARPDGA